MSPGGMALFAPVIGRLGERVIAYIDHLGRLEGLITRHFDNGFAMTIAATAAQARQARGAAHLARQPPPARLAGRPPPRPLRAAATR